MVAPGTEPRILPKPKRLERTYKGLSPKGWNDSKIKLTTEERIKLLVVASICFGTIIGLLVSR